MSETQPVGIDAAAAGAAVPHALPQMTRTFLWICAVGAAGAALLIAATVPDQDSALPGAALFALLALASAAATRLPAAYLNAALSAAFVAVLATVGANALLLGWGLRAPALPLGGLMVCMLCIVSGWRAGVLMALLSSAMVFAFAVLQPGPATGADLPSPALLLGTHLVSIFAGLTGGALAGQMLLRYARSALEREQRFRSLLALAADAYWELDHGYRLVTAASGKGPLSAGSQLGQVIWDIPAFDCAPDALDALRADMEARLPFRDVAVRWRPAGGAQRAFLASGEPRFDERGAFTGYWGVLRDITPIQAAHEALAATETRYQELFSRIPTPLVLHRDGVVLDANPAAVALFGFASLEDMIDADLLARYEAGDSRDRALDRMAQLRGAPTGTALPVASFRLAVGARLVSVRGTSVRVDTEDGPALLAIFVDDTDRLAADEAVRRSEALLSHLVATSPDLITLTEMATGRYAMVNRSFEQLSGWTAAEAVGRTALELGVWPSPEERDAFVERVRRDGSVADLPVGFRTRSGAALSLVVSAARFMMERREYMVINARDVSERERQRLEREAILANASVGIAFTRERRFILANRQFEQMFGWGPGQLIGQPGQVVWPGDADYQALGREIGPALARGEAIAVERWAQRRDGSRFLADMRGRAVDPERPDAGGTVWIIEDITERRQAEQALARARDDAEAASRAKSAFLANTSHELRTPLNGMIGLARLARDPLTDATRRAQFLDQIVESAQALAGIISDILDLSKIEAGRLQVESTVFDLEALLQTLQRTYATLAMARGLTLGLQGESAGCVRGDPLRLRQVLSNFLSNAIKFTASGGIVMRTQRRADGSFRLEVQDSGPGIDEATQARLFEPFMQGDQSTTRRFGGTGLGLSICRELATLMGGRVGVDSRPGAGSTFWAELPLPPAAAPQPADALAADPAALAGRRVLMVEDNAVNMMIAVAMLERWGLGVGQAQDGREALALLEQAALQGQPFDAVLMDVQMPVMSGHEATRALRAAGHRLPVIALTAAALVTEREQALAAGMDDFLTKPIDPERLRASLLRWCQPAAPAPDATH